MPVPLLPFRREGRTLQYSLATANNLGKGASRLQGPIPKQVGAMDLSDTLAELLWLGQLLPVGGTNID